MIPVSICQVWEGRTVSGVFPLLEWLGGSADRGVFLTVRHGLKPASIKLILAEGANADAYLAKWDAAKALSHRNLVPVMETGRCTLDGRDLVYVVTDRAEEVLSETISRSALDPDRAKSILDQALDALCYIHEKEFVHGRVKPSNIFLFADEWKLSTDSLRAAGEGQKAGHEADIYDAPEVIEGRLTPAGDVWSLGMTVAEALTQRTPAWDRSTQGDPTVPESLPEPFLEIVRGCLRSDSHERCEIAEITALLAGDAALPVVAGQVPETAQPAVAEAEPERVVEEPTPVTAEQVAVAAVPAPIAVDPGGVAVEVARERISMAADLVAHEEARFEKVEQVDKQVNERAEPAPTLRLFANLEEEHKGGFRVGRLFWGAVVLLVIGAVFLVRSHRIKLPFPIETRSAPEAVQPPPQTPAPSETESVAAPGQGATPPQSPEALPGDSGNAPAPGAPGQPAPESQPPVTSGEESKSASAISKATTQTQSPAASTGETQDTSIGSSAATSPAATGKAAIVKAATSKAVTSRVASQTPATPEVLHKADSEGAVVKQVLPTVSQGASSSMRGRVEVEVRVSVNEDGTVSDAAYVSPGPGNYFARISHQAAQSWKFRAPERDGHPKSSVWTLRYRFERENTEASAVELR
jgi:Protein kinase domain/Gram-negative bacterial TonB protein C-terminal